MRVFLTAAVMLILSAPPAAFAENGFYAGLGAGGTRVEFDLAKADLLPTSGDPLDNNNFSAASFAFKALAGYRFFDFLAVEAAYLDLGEAESTSCLVNPQGACAPDPNAAFPQLENDGNPWTVTVPFQGWTLEAVGILPIGEKWDVFAKVGVFIWEADIVALDEVAVAPGRPLPNPVPDGFPLINRSIDGEDLTAGFGSSFHATDHISVRLEFQWFDVPDTDSVWTGAVSAIYRF
jgi:hypothetical protein